MHLQYIISYDAINGTRMDVTLKQFVRNKWSFARLSNLTVIYVK